MIDRLKTSLNPYLLAKETVKDNNASLEIFEPDSSSKIKEVMFLYDFDTLKVVGIQLNKLDQKHKHKCKATNLFNDGAEDINKLADALIFVAKEDVLHIVVIEMKSSSTDKGTKAQLNNAQSLAKYMIELIVRNFDNEQYREYKFTKVVVKAQKQGKYKDLRHGLKEFHNDATRAYHLDNILAGIPLNLLINAGEKDRI